MIRWLQFIFSHSIFVSLCAAALCYQTTLLLNLPENPDVYLLVFFCTLCSYNFYWLLSKSRFNGNNRPDFIKHNGANLLLIFISVSGIIYCISRVSGVLPSLLIGTLLTFLYSLPLWPGKFIERLTRWGFMKTVLLSLTWTFVTLVLPAYDRLVLNENFLLLFSARFSFMMMLCSIFDKRDKSVDKIHGLRSLATDVSQKMLLVIMSLMFIIFFSAGFLLRIKTGDEDLPWSFIITGLVVALVYVMSLKKRNYFFYYFVVDGLMLFSAATTYLATII